MTLEYRAQRLWRPANGIEDAETAMRRAYRARAAYLRRVWLGDKAHKVNGRGLYMVALCARAMEKEAK